MKKLDYNIDVLSLGGGVQSSTILFLCEKGILPKPKIAIFADTQCEPRQVYEWVDWLQKNISFPIKIVTKGNLEVDSCRIRTSQRPGETFGRKYMWALVPAFLKQENGKVSMMGRKCTLTFKIDMVRREIRNNFPIKRGKCEYMINQAIGISTDEAHRMKDSQIKYIKNVYPLVDLGMSREDCLRWMRDNGYPTPPKSACRGCPFHSDDQWADLKKNQPEDFALAVKWEKDLQEAQRNQEALRGIPYLHRSLKPLEEVDFSKNAPGYQQISMFGNECTGLCGV